MSADSASSRIVDDTEAVPLPKQRKFVEWNIGRDKWKVDDRFDSVKLISSGAYGVVCRANDTLTKTDVVIKRLNQPFQSDIHAKRALRELKLLQFVQNRCLISLVDAYTTGHNAQSMIDLYLVTPFLDKDLHQWIQQFNQDGKILSQEHILFFMYQMLLGLKYLHSANIIHRDLKPSNVAIKDDCSLQIIDFGLGRKAKSEMTGYVQTRWYRAPEVVINPEHYTSAVDLWSLGCVLAEMLLASPLFPAQKSVNNYELLKMQISVCGTPDEATLQFYENEEVAAYIQQYLSSRPGVNFTTHFGAPQPCADLLKKLLNMNPNERLTAKQALTHPYFISLHDPDDESEASETFDDSFEEISTMVELRRAIFDDLCVL